MAKIADIIRKRPPLTLRPSANVRLASEYMRKHKIGAVLVTNSDGRLLGIFTARDAVEKVLAQGKNPDETALSEVMTAEPRTLPSNQQASDAYQLMCDAGFHHVPVVDDKKLVGIVSMADFPGVVISHLDR